MLIPLSVTSNSGQVPQVTPQLSLPAPTSPRAGLRLKPDGATTGGRGGGHGEGEDKELGGRGRLCTDSKSEASACKINIG